MRRGVDGKGEGFHGGRRGHGRGHGFRWTAARRFILWVLNSTDDYLSAEEVYRRVHEQDADISVATVYRTLNTLVEVGLIRRADTGEGKARFAAHPQGESHAQQDERSESVPEGVLVCVACGRTAPVRSETSSEDARRLSSLAGELALIARRHNGFLAERTVVQMYGRCAECLAGGSAG